MLQCAATRQNPGPRGGRKAIHSTVLCKCCKCKVQQPSTFVHGPHTARSGIDHSYGANIMTILARLAPKRVRSVRWLHHRCVVVMGGGGGGGFTPVSHRDGEHLAVWACSCSVCACRCGPMQVRQCEATVDFTGRDQGHVTSPWHCTASNRTVPYHTHSTRALVIRLYLPLSITPHRCPTLLADWPPPKRVALPITGWDGGVQSSGERSVPRLLNPFIPDCWAWAWSKAISLAAGFRLLPS